jgi:hypothetical protein
LAERDLPASSSDRKILWPVGMSDGYLMGGVYSITSPTFSKAYGASFFSHGEDGRPEERGFHHDLKLASLSFLESPLDANSETHIGSVRFSAPVFHFDPNQTR